MNLSEEFGDFVSTVRRCKARAEQLSASSALADINHTALQRLTEQFADAKVTLARIKDTPGIGTYAQAQTGLPGTDLGADYTAIVVAMDLVIANIDGMLDPIRNGVWISLIQMTSGGRWSTRSFAPASTVALRAALDTYASGLPAWIDRQA